VHGTWLDAVAVPGLAALNTGLDASIGSISCPAVGDCAAGRFYGPSGSQGTRPTSRSSSTRQQDFRDPRRQQVVAERLQ
jgi:hypothetical protein